MQDERFIKQQRNSQGFRRYLKEPAVAAALTLGLLLVVLLALPGVRVQVADQLTASEMFLYGGDPGGDDDAPLKLAEQPLDLVVVDVEQHRQGADIDDVLEELPLPRVRIRDVPLRARGLLRLRAPR